VLAGMRGEGDEDELLPLFFYRRGIRADHGLVFGLRLWAAVGLIDRLLLGCVGQVSRVSPFLLFSFSVLFSVFNSGFEFTIILQVLSI
jgi:hypothetical protein